MGSEAQGGCTVKFAETLLKLFQRLLTSILLLLLFFSAAFAIYALWDNYRIYDSAREVQERIRQWKPAETESGDAEDNSESFAGLRAVNPDVWAWLEMENTGIDYPVVQGSTNFSYMSLDIYGEYALAGSIFLDARNSWEPMDSYLLIYGHNVEEHRMFGDLTLYRKSHFFRENRDGRLILKGSIRKLRTIACLQAPEGEIRIFDPERVNADIDAMLDYVLQHSEQIDETLLQRARQLENPHFLALTTCSEDSADSRTILLTIME